MGTIGDDGQGGRPGEQERIDNEQQHLNCAEGDIDVAETPMRRLTRLEYNNAVRALFDDDTAPADDFVPDETIGGYAANAVAPATKLVVEDYFRAAEAVAASALARSDTLVGCDIADDTCVASFVDDLGLRMFRRPVSDDLRESLLAVYTDGRASWDADKGFELMLQTMLMSPHFLYHVELTLPAGDDEVVLLDGYEVASRLSFFLWQSVPDATLLAAAAAGELGTLEGIAAQSQRMLDDDDARISMESFFGQYLEIEDLPEAIKNSDHFPMWNANMARAMQRETYAFADDAMRNGGDLHALLTASYSYGDAELATLYDASPPAESFGRIELDPATRAGLLTQGSFLAGRAHADEASWVERGKFVRERLLCNQLPPPPPGVDMNQSNDPDRLTNDECKGCHMLMDPIGTGFAQYDAVGRFDDGAATATVEVLNAGDVTGNYDGPVALAHALADDAATRACIASHWFRYATRRDQTDRDKCSLENIDMQFVDAELSLSELLFAIATSDAFRYRRASK